MAETKPSPPPLDIELADLPPAERWRIWMGRVEAIIFAAAQPVPREVLSKVVGRRCVIDQLIADIRHELRDRPYEIVSVAGGYRFQTRRDFAAAIAAAQVAPSSAGGDLSRKESLALMTIAYFQPITRNQMKRAIGIEISRDLIARLKARDFITAGPRSPEPGAPYTYVTTPAFLAHFGLESLSDLPDMAELEEAGLLSKDRLGPFAGLPSAEDDLLPEPPEEDEASAPLQE
ncbi:SMC-Scp complex subunit ScpB [Telmatospirillum sp. J64-1]|uniref:SMC-Scp complex subunit ScpB n=1 Tax=Telmatospirillum sp. J64-1 TaxID=2502183 RepID=UPI00115E5F81|nr:SMC-Scp complex subunit ScpB [Telmatospirillum sp. J64-1]